jgi:hypothetical protein
VAGRKVEEVAGRNEVNPVRAKAEERAAGDKSQSPYRTNVAPGATKIIVL